MQHIVRISKDVCGSYSDFSNAVSGLVSDKICEYCHAFNITDATGLRFSLSPFGNGESDTHSLFVLKIDTAPPPLPEIKQPSGEIIY